jgi:hypothetical protein
MSLKPITKIIAGSLFLTLFFLPAIAKADTVFDLTVSPAVIDVSGCEQGQICLEKTIAIKNNSAVRADVYAQVKELSNSTGVIAYANINEFPADSSLVRWIDFYRAVIKIMPGETATQTLRITASPNAQPGKYHAIISFPTGGNLSDAQLTDKKMNEERVQINLDLVEHQVERAEINRFQPIKAFFTKNNIGFVLKIKNIGTKEVAPTGEIIIYNKGGREVGSIMINGSAIAPNEIKNFPASARLNIGPGKFKAILNINYGQDNGKNLTDIVYFSFLPLTWFLALLVFILGLLGGATFFINRKRKEKKHPASASNEHHHSAEPPPGHPKHHHKYIINLKK